MERDTGVIHQALLEQLVAEVRGLRADLARDRRPLSHLSRDDRERLARILPAVGGALGSDLFTARELVEHRSPALRVALHALNAKQLGRLLQRAEGRPLGAFIVQRDGVEVGAVLWRLVGTS